jgi:hypothetical protein
MSFTCANPHLGDPAAPHNGEALPRPKAVAPTKAEFEQRLALESYEFCLRAGWASGGAGRKKHGPSRRPARRTVAAERAGLAGKKPTAEGAAHRSPVELSMTGPGMSPLIPGTAREGTGR